MKQSQRGTLNLDGMLPDGRAVLPADCGMNNLELALEEHKGPSRGLNTRKTSRPKHVEMKLNPNLNLAIC